MKSLWIVLLAGLLALAGCGGKSSPPPNSVTLAGNWQFTVAAPSDGSFGGGVRSGFLVQKGNAVTGSLVYSITSPTASTNPCAGGSAPITGTLDGQNVTLTAVAGAQTFSFTGTLSLDNSTMVGTYTSSDGKGCGTAQTGLQWSALAVPPITGSFQGIFHSVSGSPVFNLSNQDFAVTGFLTQGDNIGASNSTVTGTLNFAGYPCLDTASVNGQISGTSVILHMIATDGSAVGQIGAPLDSISSTTSPVSFNSSARGGYLLTGTKGYGVSTIACPGANLPGDSGNICFGFGSSTGCTQPITLTPASITFPGQVVGSAPTTQTVTLSNTSPANVTLTGLSLVFQNRTSAFGGSDFTGAPSFNATDTCAAGPGVPFSLSPLQSCTITISYSPQQSCPWLPFGNPPSVQGAPPSLCPLPLMATLRVENVPSVDTNPVIAVPVSGAGLSAIVPSTPELDFGAEALGEASLPQSLSFVNQGKLPVQILPALATPCTSQAVQTLPRPLTPGSVAGLQVVTGVINTDVGNSTITYFCDSDFTTTGQNFRISEDNCSGRLLNPQDSCAIKVAYVPQSTASLASPLDYFLELNTLQCSGAATANCEIDSGRFPVELKTNAPSPLRMSPGAGLDFGIQAVGQASAPLTVTLYNDPAANAGNVNFTGNLVKGDYSETNDCVVSLPPGASCTLTITFKPKIAGFDPGTITIGYAPGQFQTVYLRGTGQWTTF